MNVKPIRINDIPDTIVKKPNYGMYVDMLILFKDSSVDAVEVDTFPRKPKSVYSSIHQAIDRHPDMFADIRCVIRRGRIFIVRDSAWRAVR